MTVPQTGRAPLVGVSRRPGPIRRYVLAPVQAGVVPTADPLLAHDQHGNLGSLRQRDGQVIHGGAGGNLVVCDAQEQGRHVVDDERPAQRHLVGRDRRTDPLRSLWRPAVRFRLRRNRLGAALSRRGGRPDAQVLPARPRGRKGRVAARQSSAHALRCGTGDEIGTVLFVVEEASGVDDAFFPAIETQRHCSLFIGNPLRDQGTFAAVCKAGDQRHPGAADRLFRKVIHVSGEDSPNVIVGRAWRAAGRAGSPPRRGPHGQVWQVPGILSYETFLEREATLRPSEKRTRLYGLFPEEAGERMFPSAWLDAAQRLGALLQARIRQRGRPMGRPFALGVDASEGGGDKSAWCVWGRFGVVEIVAKETPNTTEIAGTTLALMRRYRIKPWYVAFDAGGGGKQIADQLRERGYDEIRDVDFGGRANDSRKYMNCRAELYGELREAMQPSLGQRQQIVGRIGRMLSLGAAKWSHSKLWCASLPPDGAELREDLAVLPLLRDGEGRLRMAPKNRPPRAASSRSEKCLRDLLGRSPDQGDAAVLAYFAWQRGGQYEALAEYDGPLVYR